MKSYDTIIKERDYFRRQLINTQEELKVSRAAQEAAMSIFSSKIDTLTSLCKDLEGDKQELRTEIKQMDEIIRGLTTQLETKKSQAVKWATFSKEVCFEQEKLEEQHETLSTNFNLLKIRHAKMLRLVKMMQGALNIIPAHRLWGLADYLEFKFGKSTSQTQDDLRLMGKLSKAAIEEAGRYVFTDYELQLLNGRANETREGNK